MMDDGWFPSIDGLSNLDCGHESEILRRTSAGLPLIQGIVTGNILYVLTTSKI